MRDFLRERHVTCQVTLTISSSRPGHVTSTYKVARERVVVVVVFIFNMVKHLNSQSI